MKMGDRGFFITLEGIEGAGKTTQVPHLIEFLEKQGLTCVRTREPGGTGIGGKIRAILLNSENTSIAPEAELLLYEADRAQHLERLVRPSLEQGKCVVCDRFCDATTAYQGYARGLSLDFINSLHDQLLKNLTPDLTLLFDLTAEQGLSRARERLSDQNQTEQEGRFEAEDLSFHEKVRQGYLTIARENSGRFRIIDADQPPLQVRTQMLDTIGEFLSSRINAADQGS